jgi:hypothetical protein
MMATRAAALDFSEMTSLFIEGASRIIIYKGYLRRLELAPA